MKNGALALGVILAVGCSGPKVIEADARVAASGVFEMTEAPNVNKVTFENSESSINTGVFRKVIVEEVLPTEKYVYLRVQEGSENYWLATSKMEIIVGDTYYFRNGLLKTNFESKEYDRTFGKLFLVSTLVAENHGQGEQVPKKDIDMHGGKDQTITPVTTDISTMSIAKLVENRARLAGQKVKIRGKCTKVNAKIMGRNWIHLKDGSMDSYDLVVTSDTEIPVGHLVTFEGTVALSKDFGSGYYYDLLVEKATIINN